MIKIGPANVSSATLRKQPSRALRKVRSISDGLVRDVQKSFPGTLRTCEEVAQHLEQDSSSTHESLYGSMMKSLDDTVSAMDAEIFHRTSRRDSEARAGEMDDTPKSPFAKVALYANSRLPMDLPPLRMYLQTWPLLCLASRYASRVYELPASRKEKNTYVDADWRMGTKAMYLKSVPMDDKKVIVLAIRGTQSFMDWSVNFRTAPVAPERFLDDVGNRCHAGFLGVARKMVKPIATRLRQLLNEDPDRANHSLLITGHSAGGAVAALLYCHMYASSYQAQSELNQLTACFRRVHCVTFGAPPVSLLPLERPTIPSLKHSLFLSFINEGDPVARADKSYVKSLLDLYASPAPIPAQKRKALSGANRALARIHPASKLLSQATDSLVGAHWHIPEAALCNAGRLVVLRDLPQGGLAAQRVSDEVLRGVVFGDPHYHAMKLYAKRINMLATHAVTGSMG